MSKKPARPTKAAPRKSSKPRRTKIETRNLEMLASLFRITGTGLEIEISKDIEPEASTIKNYVVISIHEDGAKDSQVVSLVMYPGLSLTDARAALEIVYKKLPPSKQPKGGQPYSSQLYRYLAICFDWYARGVESQIFRLEMSAFQKDQSVPLWRKRGRSTINCKVIALATGASLSVVATACRHWQSDRGRALNKMRQVPRSECKD